MNKKSFLQIAPSIPVFGGAYFVAFEMLVREGIISKSS